MEFEKFEGLLSKWVGAYVCAENSFLALKTREGPRLLYGRITLELGRSALKESFEFQTEHLLAGRCTRALASGDVSGIIDQAKQGSMASPHCPVVLAGTQPPSSLSPYLTYDGQPLTLTLGIRGESKHQVYINTQTTSSFDAELRAAPIPFDSINDLLDHLGLPSPAHGVEQTTLEIVARSPGTIEASSTIINGKATIRCRVSNVLDVKGLRLGYIGKSQNTVRGSVAGEMVTWREEGDFKLGTYSPSAVEVPILQAYLSYQDILLHRSLLSDPENRLNLRHTVHKLLDPDVEFIREMLLKSQKRNADGFEPAVSLLFMQLGFAVGNYCRIPKLQEGPDLIAFSPGGNIAVIECTTGTLDQKDKLAKLVHRTAMIEAKVAAEADDSVDVQAVIVSALSKEELGADFKRAGEHKIAVLSKPDLEKALEQLALHPDADRFFEHLKKSVPVPGLQSFLGFR